MITFYDYHSRESWLAARNLGIGASEVAAAVGLPDAFMTRRQLWRLKTGKDKPKDLSENERVAYGTEAEAPLRELFRLKHRNEYEVEYHPYRVYRNDEYPCLFCTLDGELIDKQDGRKGVWECKTVEIRSAREAAEWDGKIPDRYYAQVVAQMVVTGYDFAILNCEKRYADGSAEIKEYYISRENVRESGDLEYIPQACAEFWQSVQKRKEPETVIEL